MQQESKVKLSSLLLLFFLNHTSIWIWCFFFFVLYFLVSHISKCWYALTGILSPLGRRIKFNRKKVSFDAAWIVITLWPTPTLQQFNVKNYQREALCGVFAASKTNILHAFFIELGHSLLSFVLWHGAGTLHFHVFLKKIICFSSVSII